MKTDIFQLFLWIGKRRVLLDDFPYLTFAVGQVGNVFAADPVFHILENICLHVFGVDYAVIM